MQRKLFWADLHNHNEVGYGKGSLDRSYEIAEGILDVYAFTPHGYWHDSPKKDGKITDYHQMGFSQVRSHWDRIVRKAEEAYKPRRFVTFVGYEWHSSRYGDYCVYFPSGAGEPYPAEDLADLMRRQSASGTLLIPHHSAYPPGYRGTDWNAFDPGRCPVAEVFSEHGCSFESPSPFGMYRHSMGGSRESQTIAANLKRGLKIGFTGGTDNHYGHPAAYGEGLTGIYAEALTREAIFSALKDRHCYAVTGDRIEALITFGDGMIGDTIPWESAGKSEGSVLVKGRAEILFAELLKNGEHFRAFFAPQTRRPGEGPYLLRLEWGWDEMNSPFVTDWELDAAAENGEILSYEPYFCAGPSIVDRVNRAVFAEDGSVRTWASTSRGNFYPTQTLLLRIAADEGTRLSLAVKARRSDETFETRFSAPLKDLLQDDSYVFITDTFSFPKLKVHKPLPEKRTEIRHAWTDPKVAPNDFYLLKVVQKNGHTAWTSPLWIGS